MSNKATSAFFTSVFFNCWKIYNVFFPYYAYFLTQSVQGRVRRNLYLQRRATLTWVQTRGYGVRTEKIDLILDPFSTRDLRLAGGSSLRAFSTKPPLESSTLRSLSAEGSAAPPTVLPPPASALRRDVMEARTVLLGR